MDPSPSIPLAEAPASSAPVMDVVPPEPAKPAPVAHKAKVATAPTPSKQSTPGVGAAIFATVVIVLGLAALATYAYIKTK